MQPNHNIQGYAEVEIYVDGASRGNPGPAGIGIVLKLNSKTVCFKKFIGNKTNNEAEYLALLEGLKLAVGFNAKKVKVFSDSELIVKQLKGEFSVKEERLSKLHSEVKELEKILDVEYFHVPRESNKLADELANEAIDENR
ncbi:MAG: ribonuclease HI family protein [Nitrososphaerota archaeon]|nr:ribonuclease HI family protein [Aigarchaeota archaeon]MDW8076605.1 ribonuclease HI family protein [Nitrososphaerota archaeon]